MGVRGGVYLPQRFNNVGEETQLIRGGSHTVPFVPSTPPLPTKKVQKINEYEYVYLFVTQRRTIGEPVREVGCCWVIG